ncbi:MAG: hypothetical protein KIT10_12170 [Flavobacteriales bacterium]|nr:hypothetical protein [Flavobacteriales bacterium]
MSTETTTKPTTTIVINQKSMGLALLLSFLFGPLGMLFATIAGAVVMFIIAVPVVLFTGGLGLLLTIPIGMIWSASAVNSYNRKLAGGA